MRPTGNVSTGIMEAAVTSARRKIVPLKVSGITFQSGLLNGVAMRMTAQTANPSTGNTSARAGNLTFAITFADSAPKRIAATMPRRIQSNP